MATEVSKVVESFISASGFCGTKRPPKYWVETKGFF